MVFIERNDEFVIFHGFPYWTNEEEQKIISISTLANTLIVSDVPTGNSVEQLFLIGRKSDNIYLNTIIESANMEGKYITLNKLNEDDPNRFFQVIPTMTEDEISNYINQELQ